jgi:signal transduction histidine kinase
MSAAVEAEPRPQPAGILVVDDYRPNLTALRALLESIGEVSEASSGAQALREIDRRDYAVVVIDVQMPGMDGVELARRIRAGARNAEVPIIFITAADGGLAPILEGYAAGAVDYLRRPLEAVVLRAKVSTFVELHQRREQARSEAADRARLEAERAAVERASREKDQFLALLSHELRTPLTSILLWSDMLLNKEMPRDVVRRGLETIDACARQEERLVENVLEMSRLVTGTLSLEIEKVDVAEVLAEVVAEASQWAIDRGVQLVHAGAAAGPYCGLFDRRRIRQVLANLLGNALKFTSAAGRVDVSLEGTRSTVRIQIRDTGVGFAPEVAPQLFSRFKQLGSLSTRSQGGLGMGLSLAKALVDLHGGNIVAESEGAGKGASFTVWLPINDDNDDNDNHPRSGKGRHPQITPLP